MIAYWTTTSLEPRIEAIAKEVALLAEFFRPSFVFSLSSHYWLRLSRRRRYFGVHQNLELIARPLVRLLENAASVSHVYGDLTPWTYHRALRARPLVHTVASEKGTPVDAFLHRCNAIVVQTPRLARRLIETGVEPERVSVLFPGVDTRTYVPVDGAPVHLPVKILFATAPRAEAELPARGVPLLLKTAQQNPDLHITLLFRPWQRNYTSLPAVRHMLYTQPLANVTLLNETVLDMPNIYRGHHFTVVPFLTPEAGKECPNSMVESLACGIPVLISAASPMADFISDTGGGVVFQPTPASLAAAVATGLSNWPAYSRAAATTARRYMDIDQVLRRYHAIYDDARHQGPLRTPF